MSQPSFQDQLNMKAQLDKAKQESAEWFNSDPEPEANEDMPTWMASSAGAVQAEALTADLEKLLSQMELIQGTDNADIIDNYFQQVVKELTTIFYVRMTLLEDDDEDGRAQLADEFDTICLQIATELGVEID